MSSSRLCRLDVTFAFALMALGEASPVGWLAAALSVGAFALTVGRWGRPQGTPDMPIAIPVVFFVVLAACAHLAGFIARDAFVLASADVARARLLVAGVGLASVLVLAYLSNRTEAWWTPLVPLEHRRST